MIVVVEGPSASGKTTWCSTHADLWLPEPGRLPAERLLEYQRERWRQAVAASRRGQQMVLDGDPFKLYYAWAQLRLNLISAAEWRRQVEATKALFRSADCGLADLVLYSDPGEEELRRRKAADTTRSRGNFEVHTAMRPCFRRWYEAVATLDPGRVIWEQPAGGTAALTLQLGPREQRSHPGLVDAIVEMLPPAGSRGESD